MKLSLDEGRMNLDEIRKARGLIAAVGNPQGFYAEEVMKLFHDSLDSLEVALLQIEGMRKLLAKALCDCGPYTEVDPAKHDALGCRYRNCIEKAEEDGVLAEKRNCGNPLHYQPCNCEG